MERLFTDYPQFKLITKKLNFRVVTCILIFGFKKKYEYHLPDSSYGEYVLYTDGKPKYYFNAFKENGEEKDITKHILKNKLTFDDFLLQILKNSGLENIDIFEENPFSIRLDSNSLIETIELYEIVDK